MAGQYYYCLAETCHALDHKPTCLPILIKILGKYCALGVHTGGSREYNFGISFDKIKFSNINKIIES